MKVSNETKVGALTSVAIVLLFLGFNFLKGKSLFKTGEFLYVNFAETKGIMVSNPVFVNGYPVGNIYEIESTDASLKNLKVAIKLKEKYNIPDNSVAYIDVNPLGVSSIIIQLGDSKNFLAHNGEIKSINNAGILGEFKTALLPVANQINTTTHTLDSVLKNINSIFDATAKNNLQTVIANLNKTTASLTLSATAIEKMLQEQNGSITQSLNNVNSFTKNLSANNEKITTTLNNLETTTANLSKTDLNGTVNGLKQSIEKLNLLMQKVQSKDGSLGMLLNDKNLYNNLNNTVRSANILLDDLKTHPKRYVNISVFGKKDKTTPLSAPLNDSSRKP